MSLSLYHYQIILDNILGAKIVYKTRAINVNASRQMIRVINTNPSPSFQYNNNLIFIMIISQESVNVYNKKISLLDLPKEVIDYICSFLTYSQLSLLESTCKYLKCQVCCTRVWKRECIRLHRLLISQQSYLQVEKMLYQVNIPIFC